MGPGRVGNVGRASRHILGRGGCRERGWGGEDRVGRKAKASPPRQQLLANMSQLVKEAEIEASGKGEGQVACPGPWTHRKGRTSKDQEPPSRASITNHAKGFQVAGMGTPTPTTRLKPGAKCRVGRSLPSLILLANLSTQSPGALPQAPG